MRISLPLTLFIGTVASSIIEYRNLKDIPKNRLLPHNINPIRNSFHVGKRSVEEQFKIVVAEDEDYTLDSDSDANLLGDNKLQKDEDDYEVDNKKDDKDDDDDDDYKVIKKTTPVPESCVRDNHLIESVTELHNLQTRCTEIGGNLIISPIFDSSIVDLGSITKVQGNIIIENSSNVVKLNAYDLRYITGDFILNSLTSIVSVTVPKLKTVRSIDWKVLPILNNVDISADIIVDNNIIISDTSISNIDGFQKIREIDIFNINNNRFLETIKTNIITINKQLSVHANARDLELEMPMLKVAENITIRDTSTIWLPKLEFVSSSFEVIENLITHLEVPNLKFVGGTLGIIENFHLNTANFNNVTEIQGGLMIANNKNLEKIDFFENLKQIGGAIHFEGKFKDTNFENLKLVKGSAFIKTSSENLDCNKWIVSPNGRSIIRGGKIKCSSSRKQKFLNVDKEGKIIEKLENDIVDEGDSDNIDNYYGDQQKNGNFFNKKISTKKNKNGSNSKMTNDSNSMSGLSDIKTVLILSIGCLLVTHLLF